MAGGAVPTLSCHIPTVLLICFRSEETNALWKGWLWKVDEQKTIPLGQLRVAYMLTTQPADVLLWWALWSSRTKGRAAATLSCHIPMVLLTTCMGQDQLISSLHHKHDLSPTTLLVVVGTSDFLNHLWIFVISYHFPGEPVKLGTSNGTSTSNL